MQCQAEYFKSLPVQKVQLPGMGMIKIYFFLKRGGTVVQRH